MSVNQTIRNNILSFKPFGFGLLRTIDAEWMMESVESVESVESGLT